MLEYDRKTLFSICALCDGTGKLPEELAGGMEQCICDGKGFVSSGLTTRQVDHWKFKLQSAESQIAKLKALLNRAKFFVWGAADGRELHAEMHAALLDTSGSEVRYTQKVQLKNYGGSIACKCGGQEWEKESTVNLWTWDDIDVNPTDEHEVDIYRCANCGRLAAIKCEPIPF